MRSTKLWATAAVAAGGLLLGYAGIDQLMTQKAHAAAAPAQAKRVDNFRLADQNMKAHELYRLAGAKAVVLITQGNGCPIVRNNAVGYKAFHDAYKAKGVEFLMLNSNLQDTREAVQAEAKEYSFTIPILMDTNQLVGEQLGVERTAEVFVINPKTWQVVYRGPMDDRVVFERQKAKADKTWAKDALDALLAGRRVPVAFQQTNGCLINFPERAKKARA